MAAICSVPYSRKWSKNLSEIQVFCSHGLQQPKVVLKRQEALSGGKRVSHVPHIHDSKQVKLNGLPFSNGSFLVLLRFKEFIWNVPTI